MLLYALTSSRHCRPLRLAMKMPQAISHYFEPFWGQISTIQ